MSDRFSDLTPLQPELPAPGGDSVPQRGDSTPAPEPLEGAAGLEQAADAVTGRDTVPFRGDSDSTPDAPLHDIAPAASALDGGAGQTLAEAARSIEGAPGLAKESKEVASDDRPDWTELLG